MPAWATRRRNLRTCALLSNHAGTKFIALLIITGTLTWLLGGIRSGSISSSPLSQIPEFASPPVDQINTSIDDITLLSKPQGRNDVANSTLNFQQIFAINLESRVDRKDLLTVMALCTNISVTIVPGVRTVSDNSLPPSPISGALRPEEYAVWRSHAKVWRKVIEDGLETALILEDDNDWDVNLKDQIPRIMDALDEIRTTTSLEEGEGLVRGSQGLETWDILYLGSCFEQATLEDAKNRKTVVRIPSDHENVAPHNYNWVLPPALSGVLIAG